MLHTKEDAKKAILEYLIDAAKNKCSVEEYTLSKISEVVQADSTQIEKGIEELRDEGLIESRKVELDICTPKNDDGFKILAVFAKKGYITYSPYWAIIFSVLSFFIGYLIWANFQTSLSEATRIEVPLAILASLGIGIVGGQVLQSGLSRFRQWKLVSVEAYRIVSTLIKNTAYVFLPLLATYYGACIVWNYRFELTGVIALLAVSITVAFGWYRIKMKIDAEKKDDIS